MGLLDRPYNYGNLDLKYTVGQPMGAYSSFAMLALTNHVIMWCAYKQSTGETFDLESKAYGILGDDVVIRDQQLATSYIWLMNTVLGVEINPIKGFSGKLIEFAKN